MSGPRAATLRAPAKVNLALRVLWQRDDGFHELETVFQAVDLCDDVRVERVSEGLSLDVVGAELGPPERNLAYRAAQGALEATGLEGGLAISLTKRIPTGAGLGGGSSDAAAVLRCVAALADGAGGASNLYAQATSLGSDVPFFLGESPLALGRGRGERLVSLPALPAGHLVLVSPPVHVSTAWAYAELAARRRRGQEPPKGGAERVPTSWEDVATLGHNDFQKLVSERHPEVARGLAALSAAGADLALMSGSGSTSFGLFPDASAAERAADRLAGELCWPCAVVRTLSVLPAPALEDDRS